MAQSPARRKKPRIRKSAPTIREKADAAQANADKTPKREKLNVSRLRHNPVTAFLGKILRPIGRVLYKITPKYFINSWHEVRQVTWPSRRETWRLTGAVFVFALVFGTAVAIVDKGLDEIFKKVILK